VVIHALEAYVLNPRIVSAVMKVNPVITLMILYIAHSLMGLWGMLLGVPISVFFFSQIEIKEPRENGHNGQNGPNGLKNRHDKKPPKPPNEETGASTKGQVDSGLGN
jgi:hypothetical protein